MDKYFVVDMVNDLSDIDKNELLVSLLAPRVEKLPKEDQQYLWHLLYNNSNKDNSDVLFTVLRRLLMEKQ